MVVFQNGINGEKKPRVVIVHNYSKDGRRRSNYLVDNKYKSSLVRRALGRKALPRKSLYPSAPEILSNEDQVEWGKNENPKIET